MTSISNLKIGTKISLALGATVLLAICLAGFALWSVRAIHAAMKDSERQSTMMTSAEKISADVGAIAQRVATMTLSRKFGKETMAQISALRADYMATFDALKSMAHTEEGKRQLGRIDSVLTQWSEADNRLLATLQAGKPADAANLHRE